MKNFIFAVTLLVAASADAAEWRCVPSTKPLEKEECTLNPNIYSVCSVLVSKNQHVVLQAGTLGHSDTDVRCSYPVWMMRGKLVTGKICTMVDKKTSREERVPSYEVYDIFGINCAKFVPLLPSDVRQLLRGLYGAK